MYYLSVIITITWCCFYSASKEVLDKGIYHNMKPPNKPPEEARKGGVQ